MPHKRGARNLWIDGKVYGLLQDKLKEEEWPWGLTKKIEMILLAYILDQSVPQLFEKKSSRHKQLTKA